MWIELVEKVACLHALVETRFSASMALYLGLCLLLRDALVFRIRLNPDPQRPRLSFATTA